MAIRDLVVAPFRVATSRLAQRAYINAILFIIASQLLLALSTFAYGLFYINYIPQIGIERVVHLQYGDGPHPYGIVSLSSGLISQQPYDVHLTLHVPRSPPNIQAGNFMLELDLLSPSYKPIVPTIPTHLRPITTLSSAMASVKEEDILFASRRPAILTYTSRLVSLSERLASLPLYLLGLRKESEVLSVPMAELLEFRKGWKNIPGFALLELQAGQNIQVYDIRLHFTARFSGLRWWMYNYPFLSAQVGVLIFWCVSSAWTLLVWAAIYHIVTVKDTVPKDSIEEKETNTSVSQSKIKKEPATDDEPDLSDTPRTFPTYGRQPPLRYEPKVKDGTGSEELTIDETTIQPLAAEADDEDDDVGYRGVDSGLGTSYSEGGRRSSITRRRSKGKDNA